MSVSYRAVDWNPWKKRYDLVLIGGVLLYLVVFAVASGLLRPQGTLETTIIRALGTCAFLLLHIILSIGPLSRLDTRFLPLLYNRRHLGVTMFLVGLAHGLFSLVQFHAIGDTNPLLSVLTSNGDWGSFAHFPFQALGLAALSILFLMAATSHDFWLANLTAPVWKTLHMAVYLAYGLLVLHVALGVLQAETDPVLATVLGLGVVWVFGLHTAVALRERQRDRSVEESSANREGYVAVCAPLDVPEDRARIFCLAGERVALFRYDGKLSAISNVCQHQNGPLGEGRVIDGCVTCPWHGYQYNPDTGSSPPPFTEKIPTFRVRVADGKVWIHPQPNPAGTAAEPARL